jgi:hypothetical protein
MGTEKRSMVFITGPRVISFSIFLFVVPFFRQNRVSSAQRLL